MTTILLKVMLLSQRTLDSSYPGVTQDTQQLLTRTVGVISSSWFLLRLLPSPNFKITGDKTQCATTVNKITIPRLIINHWLNLYREPASIQQNLYPDGKNHAVPSLHRDFYSAKVPGSVPGAASGNAYKIIPPGRYSAFEAHDNAKSGFKKTHYNGLSKCKLQVDQILKDIVI